MLPSDSYMTCIAVLLSLIDFSLKREPVHIPSLASLAAIGILNNDSVLLQRAETSLRSRRTGLLKDGSLDTLLMEISRLQGRNIRDVSRTGIMLDPSSVREWSNLSNGGDIPSRFARVLAQQDNAMSTEEVSMIYAKTGCLGDIQCSILLSPWRVNGWYALEALC